jgi:hypothetical protein
MADRPQHPSGRPVPRRDVVKLGFTRCPPDEPLTPGLRKGRERTEAIGFPVSWPSDSED